MVYVDGVGTSPEDVDSTIGKCSQYACFALKSMVDLLNLNGADVNNGCEPSSGNNKSQENADRLQVPEQNGSMDPTDTTVVYPIEKFPYKLLFSTEYPEFIETRSHINIILDDVKYYIHRHTVDDSRFFDEDSNSLIMPIEEMMPFVHEAASVAELREIIKNDYTIDSNNCIVYSLDDDDSNSSNSYPDYDYSQSNTASPESDRQCKDNVIEEEW